MASRMLSVLLTGAVLSLSLAQGLEEAKVEAASKCTYVIVAPRSVRPGNEYSLNVVIKNTSSDVIVEAKIQEGGPTANTSLTLQPESQGNAAGKLTLTIPKEMRSVNSFILDVRGSGGLTFGHEGRVFILRKAISIFIQTDKSQYKPSNKVRMRVFVVDSNLKPQPTGINITIKDSDSNMIKKWDNQLSRSGIIEKQLELSDEPVLGVWTIEAKAMDELERKSFEVAEYVLPKVEVEIEMAKFVSYDVDSVNGSVRAKYTYGQPVNGAVNITFKTKHRQLRVLIMKQLTDGKADFSIQTEQLRRRFQIRRGERGGSPNVNIVMVNATVRDSVTNKTYSEEIEVFFRQIIYTITPINVPRTFKRGVEYEALIQVKNMNGGLLTDKDLTSEGDRVVLVYKFEFRGCKHEVTMEDYSVVIGYDGYATIKHNRDYDCDYISFTALFEGARYTSKQIRQFKSLYDNGTISLSLKTATGMLMAGDEFKVEVTTIGKTEKFTLCIIGRGGMLLYCKTYAGSTKTVSVTVTTQMSPSSRIIAWFETQKGEIISDSITFNIKDMFQNKVTVAFNNSETKPGLPLKLTATASPGSYVALLAVDQSVLLLGDSHDITQTQVENEMKSYENRPRSDELVVNSGTLFENAGVHFFTDSLVLKAAWSSWTRWSRCPVTCAKGIKVRHRWCIGGAPGNIGCRGHISERQSCSRGVCPVWSVWAPWASWTRCGTTCGRGFTQRRRICGTGTGREQCRGRSNQWRSCHVRSCAIWWPQGEAGPDGGGVAPRSIGRSGESGVQGGSVDDEPAKRRQNQSGKREPVKHQSSTSTQAPTRIRKFLPETWIWSEQSIDSTGRMSMDVVAPDTITSWVASAFALHETDGLGVATRPAKTTVFKPFFISLNLPYSVIRNEEFALQASVFNYMDQEVTALVTLEQSLEFSVRLGGPNLTGNPALNQEVQENTLVPPGGAESVYFWIVPNTLGRISLQIKAQTTMAADALRRILLVEPEGIEKEFTDSHVIDLTRGNESVYSMNMETTFPETTVPGSERVIVSIVGHDPMSQSLNGIQNLIRMPYGCGEQNMITFVPNIVALGYLKCTKKHIQDVESNAIRFMEAGYMRELTYKHRDGSFSAFGERDGSGSLWLTTFVVRSFHSAKSYIFIDDNVIDQAISWILLRQIQFGSNSGSFSDPGRVIHSEMQGGSSKGAALTAYVLATLCQVGDPSTAGSAITKAVTYLMQDIPSKKPYVLAIITYALHVCNSQHKDSAFSLFQSLAINNVNEGVRYWETTKTVDTAGQPKWHRWRRAKASDIELNSYALLIYLQRGMMSESHLIAKWLMSQRNANGGFSSTQDTVLGLQALAELSCREKMPKDQNLQTTVIADQSFYYFESITKNNYILLQTAEFPGKQKELRIHAVGRGMAILQVVVEYNVVEDEEMPAINAKVSTVTTENSIRIRICNSWHGVEISGMVVIEVHMLSGYSPEETNHELQQRLALKGIKRVETKGKALIFYLDELTSRSICFEITAIKVELINDIKDAKVVTYQYYSPDQKTVVMYSLSGVQKKKDRCKVCDLCCKNEQKGNKKKIEKQKKEEDDDKSRDGRARKLSLP